MVHHVREVSASVGTVDYSLDEKKKGSRKYARSLFVVKDVRKGEPVTADNVRSIRPSDGMQPKYYEDVLGCVFSQNVKRGTPFRKNFIVNVNREEKLDVY